MPLSIKNEHVEKLARSLARETGKSITAAVEDALEAALLRAKGRRSAPARKEVILRIGRRCAALPDVDRRPADAILGYDRTGGFG